MSKQAKSYWSREYGILKRTFLHDIPGFSITRCIVNDPMHVLLEGIDIVELVLLLRVFINKMKFFSLESLNASIRNFLYDEHDARVKPQEIRALQLENVSTLRQTAASMKILMFILPLLISEHIPQDEEHWKNCLRLLQINILCFSSVVSQRCCTVLEDLIFQHNTNFIRLYPNQSFIPKLHYMIHLPSQMKLFGPLRNMWCMRFEGKHAVFKNKKWRNFKNLPKSVADYHQQWMCLQQCGIDGLPSPTYLYMGDKVKEGRTVVLKDLPYFTLLESENLDGSVLSMVTDEVNLSGHMYQKNTVLLLKWENMEDTSSC